MLLVFKKNKVDRLLGTLKSFDVKTQKLKKIIEMFENEKIYDLQLDDGNEQVGEAFFSHFLKMRRALELPDFIRNKISSNKEQIITGEEISQFYRSEISSSCPHKTKISIDRYKYDMHTSTDTYCSLCGMCEQH
jgi:hypothetical protein